jgi:septal ring factor EnvC (AmiA/AmiB activator)
MRQTVLQRQSRARLLIFRARPVCVITCWRQILCVSLLLVVAVGLPGVALGEDAARAEKELKQLRFRISQLEKQLARSRARESSIVAELGKVEKKLGGIKRELRETNLRQQKAEKNLAELRNRRAEEFRGLEVLRERMISQLRTAYALGRQEHLKIWLSQEDPAAAGRMLTYHQYLTRDRAARMDAVREQLGRLAGTETEIDREARELSAVYARQKEEMAALRETKAKRSKVLQELRTGIRSQDTRLAQAQDDKKRLEKLIRDLRMVLEAVPQSGVVHTGFGKLKRKLPWPVKGKLAASYGQRRTIGNGNLKWRGVFIETGAGAGVHAVSRGRVAFSDWLRGFGLLLILDHGDGYMSLYGYNQALYKSVGEWAEAGEVIATAGDSGGGDRTGLYFELRHRGKTINPLKWCAGEPKA